MNATTTTTQLTQADVTQLRTLLASAYITPAVDQSDRRTIHARHLHDKLGRIIASR